MKVGGRILQAKVTLGQGSEASMEGESRTADHRDRDGVVGKKSGLRWPKRSLVLCRATV